MTKSNTHPSCKYYIILSKTLIAHFLLEEFLRGRASTPQLISPELYDNIDISLACPYFEL